MTALPPAWLQAPAVNLALHSTKHKYNPVLPTQGPWCSPEIPPFGLLWCWSLNSPGNTHYAVSSRSFCLLMAIWLQINSILPSNPSLCPLESTTSSKTSLKVKQNRKGSYFFIEPGLRCTATVLSVLPEYWDCIKTIMSGSAIQPHQSFITVTVITSRRQNRHYSGYHLYARGNISS